MTPQRVLFVALFFLAAAYRVQCQQPVSDQPTKSANSHQKAITSADLEGLWLATTPASAQNAHTYEFRLDGKCKFSMFGRFNTSYDHVGEEVKVKIETTSTQVWKSHIEGDKLTLQLFGDLPACPFRRIGAMLSDADPLVGAWQAEPCAIPKTSPGAGILEVLVSNAVFRFGTDHALIMRYRFEETEPYTLHENKISCPVLGMKGDTLTWTLESSIPVLLPSGGASKYIRRTPGQVLALQFIPGDLSEENRQIAEDAITALKAELRTNPNDLAAIDQIGRLLFMDGGRPFDVKKLQESKSYFQRHSQLDPRDQEAFCWIGLDDWIIASRANKELRSSYYLQRESSQTITYGDPLPPSVRVEYATKYAKTVDEGITSLRAAIDIVPDYDLAMLYLALLYREKSDMAESIADRRTMQKTSDEMQNKAAATQKRKATQGNATDGPSTFDPNSTTPPHPVFVTWLCDAPFIGVPGHVYGGVIGGVIGGVNQNISPDKSLAVGSSSRGSSPNKITVGGVIQAQHLLSRVEPVYPALARQTRVSGVVKLRAIIAKDGSVEELQAVSGHPLLIQSALDAVKQWRYQPTLINGIPVMVDTEIDVIFALADKVK